MPAVLRLRSAGTTCRFDQVAAAERLSKQITSQFPGQAPATGAAVWLRIRHLIKNAVSDRRGTERKAIKFRLSEQSRTKEATTVQITAHSASDNSNTAITTPGLISRGPRAGFPSDWTVG